LKLTFCLLLSRKVIFWGHLAWKKLPKSYFFINFIHEKKIK
jgi:hypothetical protein